MDVLVYLTLVITLGIVSQWVAWRAHLPAILLLLISGFLLLPVYEWCSGDQKLADQLIGDDVLFPLVSLAVAVILFEGGLSLRFSELRGTGGVVFRLVTVGVFVTWILTTGVAWFLFDIDLAIATLLGAILTVSGPTVVGPLLRYVRPSPRVGSLAKWEGIVNDPVGAVLAVLVFEAVHSGAFSSAAMITIWAFLKTAIVGVVGGGLTALVLVQLMRRYLIPDFLQNAAFLAAVVASFTASNLIQPEAGLVTVTFLGIALANQKSVTVKHVVEFKENLRVLLISILFILLASRLRWDDVQSLGWAGLFFVAALLGIRFAAVFASTMGTDLLRRERIFLSCLHPRGIVAAAVSSLFALEIQRLAHLGELPAPLAEQAQLLAPITFVVIVGTVAVYGLSISPIARRLGLAETSRDGILFAGAEGVVRAIAKSLHEEGCVVRLVDTNQQNISATRMEGLPTCYASILSEYVKEELDLGAIGRLVAMTPNDEVNTLAAMEFAEVFGRAGVYQLAPETNDGQQQVQVSPHLRARILFRQDVTSVRLRVRFATGAVVKKTPLTEEFTFDHFCEMYGSTAIPLFTIVEGKVNIITADDQSTAQPGCTLISLVDMAQD
jgi:NhaP-type Na+/H+ or K+/H+ antiporter